MEPLNYRKIRSSLNPGDNYRESTDLDTDWDTRKSSKKKRLNSLLWVAVLTGAVLFAVVGAALLRTKAQAGRLKDQRFDPPMVTRSSDQETAEKEVKMVLDCVAAFFGSSSDLLKVAQCRPVPGLVKVFEANKTLIAMYARSAPSPGGNIKRKPPYIGIPISFSGLPPRTAWVEIRGTAARLDLESFVGHGSVPWPELENAPAGSPVFLRGTLVPVDGSDDRMDFISPDGQAQIRINGWKPDELSSHRAARVTVARVAESPVVSKGWIMVAFEGWEWLADLPKESSSR